MNFISYKLSFLVFILSCTSASIIREVEPPLRYLSVLFRHGDRTPENNGHEGYPNDPYKDEVNYPEGFGALTNAGRSRAYELGTNLRKLYNNFLGNKYNAKEVGARSTDFDRTKMSLQLVMANLFEPSGLQQWNQNLNWQPTVVNFVPGFLDAMMRPHECPKFREEYLKVKQLPEVKKKLADLDGLMKNLTEWTGKNISTELDMLFLYLTLAAQHSKNFKLPEWTNEIFPHGPLEQGASLVFQFSSHTPQMNRLNGGLLLKNITENMEKVRNSRHSDRKIMLYSGHETNMAGFLLALGIYTPHVPAYSSAVIVELRGDSKQEYFIKIRYYKGIPSESTVLRIPGCEELCPFETFLNLTRDSLPSKDDMNCNKVPQEQLVKLVYEKFSKID